MTGKADKTGAADSALPFWRAKALAEMTRDEWESLCDGCGRCCLLKLQDEDDVSRVEYTNVACRLLHQGSCRCTDYLNRHKQVSDCVSLGPDNLEVLDWMPETCAYRRLRDGKDLMWWHHLVSGDRDTVHRAGISVRGRVFAENDVPEAELEAHLVTWPWK